MKASNVELFTNAIHGFKPLTIFVNSSTFQACTGYSEALESNQFKKHCKRCLSYFFKAIAKRR